MPSDPQNIRKPLEDLPAFEEVFPASSPALKVNAKPSSDENEPFKPVDAHRAFDADAAARTRENSPDAQMKATSTPENGAPLPPEGGEPLAQAGTDNRVRKRNSRRAAVGDPPSGGRGAVPGTSAEAPSRRKRNPRRTIAHLRRWGVRAVMAVMAVGCVLGFAFFLRPTMSNLENRNLTKFPEITLETFLDGTFTSDVSLWYADTFPLREPLVKMNLAMKGLFGIQPETQLIGGNRTSDELPPQGERTEPTTTHERPRNIDAPEARLRAAEIENQITDGIYVDTNAGACYTLYYFDQGATQAYVDVINDAADLLDGKAKVYSVLLPTNAGVMLDDATLAKLGVPNQDQAIDYFYSLMNDKVTPVETFDALKQHDDEYLYFRTDHHWQQLAAYYVYASFCSVKGTEPAPYDKWQQLEFPDYYGEYRAARENGFAADTVYARIPQGTNEMEYWLDDTDDSTRMEGPVITDLSSADSDTNKYNCFVCGNRPLSHIHNPNVTDGSSCLVVKDSFGNPFVSVLVDDYEDIYTIDFRFTNQKLVDLVEEHGIKDVIFENVLMFAGTYDCSDLLATIVYPPEGQGSDASADTQSGEGEGASASSASSEKEGA